MFRPLSVKIALGLVAAFSLTTLGWLAGPVHDGDEEAEAVQARNKGITGPDPKQPLDMPRGIVGLEIRLGLRYLFY